MKRVSRSQPHGNDWAARRSLQSAAATPSPSKRQCREAAKEFLLFPITPRWTNHFRDCLSPFVYVNGCQKRDPTPWVNTVLPPLKKLEEKKTLPFSLVLKDGGVFNGSGTPVTGDQVSKITKKNHLDL